MVSACQCSDGITLARWLKRILVISPATHNKEEWSNPDGDPSTSEAMGIFLDLGELNAIEGVDVVDYAMFLRLKAGSKVNVLHSRRVEFECLEALKQHQFVIKEGRKVAESRWAW
eukprot:TRINITY_DN1306_c0_g1_i1.p4 TRINITY_DN1306_c0_g1~~TRINITY_DN1306_c0_g1_i1.p4  ORF type:complete len:115 (+),score=24.35 TRINITY_DN1306_c0_g1_i1:325-669(+)